MRQFSLNLSTRPFKPYRAINLGLLIVLFILIAASAGQVYIYQQNSSLAASIRGDQQRIKAEADRLNREVQALGAKMYSANAATKMEEVEFLNQILLRKSFSWTRVFANLEEIMPDNVFLLNLRPFVDDAGKMGLNIEIRGKSHDDAVAFVRTLEESAIFGAVAVAVEERTDAGEVEMSLSAYYFPEAEVRVSPKGAE